MRRTIPQTEWDQLRAAHMAGAPLRQLARNAGINEGTMLMRAHREKWAEQRTSAQAIVAQAQQSDAQDLPAVVPAAQAAALTTAEGTPVLSLAEKRTFLRSVVTTPIGQVDENSPLAQSVKRRAITTRNGDTCHEAEIKTCDKLRALELDARLARELGTDDQRHLGPLVSLNFIATPEAHLQVHAIDAAT